MVSDPPSATQPLNKSLAALYKCRLYAEPHIMHSLSALHMHAGSRSSNDPIDLALPTPTTRVRLHLTRLSKNGETCGNLGLHAEDPFGSLPATWAQMTLSNSSCRLDIGLLSCHCPDKREPLVASGTFPDSLDCTIQDCN